MISHIVKGTFENTAEKAAISAIRLIRSQYETNSQAVHIIMASLILINKRWRAVFSIVQVPDIDDVYAKAIIFGHLPHKYADLYDALLPEVDHLNLIEDESVWTNIKLYLLDVYFYQAVNFGKLKRITDTGGGYLKQEAIAKDSAPDLLALFLGYDFTGEDGMPLRLHASSHYVALAQEQAALIHAGFDRLRNAAATHTIAPAATATRNQIIEKKKRIDKKRQTIKQRRRLLEKRHGSVKMLKLMKEMGFQYEKW